MGYTKIVILYNLKRVERCRKKSMSRLLIHQTDRLTGQDLRLQVKSFPFYSAVECHTNVIRVANFFYDLFDLRVGISYKLINLMKTASAQKTNVNKHSHNLTAHVWTTMNNVGSEKGWNLFNSYVIL